MPFSPNDSVDILIRARTEGEASLRSLGGASASTDAAIKQLTAAILGLDATAKTLDATVSSLNPKLTQTGAAAGTAATGVRNLGGSARDAAAELRLLEGAMPLRSAAQFLASMDALKPVLAGIFPVVGMIALAELLSKIPGEIHKGILALEGWTEKSKSAYEKSIQDVDKYYLHLVSINAKIRNLNLIGLTGTAKDATEESNARAQLAEVQARLDEAHARLAKNRDTIDRGTHPEWYANHMKDMQQGMSWMGGHYKPPAPVPDMITVERNKVEYEETLKLIKDLGDQKELLTKVTIPSAHLQTGADARDEAAKAGKKLQEDRDRAQRIATTDIRQGEEKGMNPAEKFSRSMSDNLHTMLGLDPNMDLSKWRAAVQKGLKEMSQVVSEEYQKEQRDLHNFTFGNHTSHEEWKFGNEEMLRMMGYTKDWVKDQEQGWKNQDELQREGRSNRIANYSMTSRFNTRMAGITSGPANQMHAFYGAQSSDQGIAQQNYLASMKDAQGKEDQVVLEKKAADLFARETAQIEYDTALKIAEIKKQQREEDRKVLGELFDAMDSGTRGAIGKLFKSKVEGLERTMFTNAMEAPMHAISSGVRNIMTPYELNGDGSANLLGKILQGTPFGINQASPEIKSRDKNTQAIESLTNAITGKGDGTSSSTNMSLAPWARIASAAGGPVGAVGGSLPGLFGAFAKMFSGRGAPGTTGEITQSDIALLNSGSWGPDMLGGGSGAGYAGSVNFNGSAKKLTSGQQAAQIGAQAAMGALAMYEGIKQGGAQGTASAVSGGLGAASAIPGPQQPFVAAASVIAGIVAYFMGQSVADRYKQMNNNVMGAYDRLPLAQQEQFDISGYQSDMTGPGSARAVGVNINIHAFDAKSIIDHWEPIAKAIQHAVNMGHPVVDAVRQAR